MFSKVCLISFLSSFFKKNTFSILLPQKIFLGLLPWNVHFQNCSLKKYFLKIAPSKNTFSKILSQIRKNKFWKNLFKIACFKSTFSKLLSKKTFLKFFSQKKYRSFKNIFYQNYFLEKDIFKKHEPHRFNLFFIRLIRRREIINMPN